MNAILLLIAGLAVGVVSGIVGIGGGVLFVPLLIYLFKFSQLDAQGTTLALMVPPIGILAAYAYYTNGHVHIKTALFLAAGFLFGGFLGAVLAQSLPQHVLRKVFAVFMALIAAKMFFKR